MENAQKKTRKFAKQKKNNENVITSDFQSEVGEVFRRNWWRTSGEVWKEIFELLLLGKSSEAFSTKTPPQISPSNFTTRFWVVAGPKNGKSKDWRVRYSWDVRDPHIGISLTPTLKCPRRKLHMRRVFQLF